VVLVTSMYLQRVNNAGYVVNNSNFRYICKLTEQMTQLM